MALSWISGPFGTFGASPVSSSPAYGQAPEYNPNRGPSIFDQGIGILDPRLPFTYFPGNNSSQVAYGWFGTGRIPVLATIPSSADVASLSSGSSQIVSGTALTFTSSSLATGWAISQSVVNSLTGATVTGLRAVGQSTSTVLTGAQQGVAWYHPSAMLSRNITVTSSTSQVPNGASFTVAGYDLYGYPMTEIITLSSGSSQSQTASGKKAFKYVASVTPGFSDSSLSNVYKVGTGNVFGFPLLVPAFPYAEIFFGSSSGTLLNPVTSSLASFVAPLGSSITSDSTTADVRGTFSVTANATDRLVVFVTPSISKISSYVGTYPSGLVGVIQA